MIWLHSLKKLKKFRIPDSIRNMSSVRKAGEKNYRINLLHQSGTQTNSPNATPAGGKAKLIAPAVAVKVPIATR
jgi:hypothetical protein